MWPIAEGQLAKGKASGSDGMPIEAYCALAENDEFCNCLLALINGVFRTGHMPIIWKEIVHIPIPKKGDLSELKNWRAICLINHVVKLMNRMILNRLQPEIEPRLRNTQFGFRPLRSAVGAQAIFTEILHKALRGPQNVYIGYIDYKSAFPSVSHRAIEAALKAFLVPPGLSKLIMASYASPTGFVRTPFGNTENLR